MRELTKNELNIIAGGDSDDFAKAGWDIGRAIGAITSAVSAPYLSKKFTTLGGQAGLQFGHSIDNLLRQK